MGMRVVTGQLSCNREIGAMTTAQWACVVFFAFTTGIELGYWAHRQKMKLDQLAQQQKSEPT